MLLVYLLVLLNTVRLSTHGTNAHVPLLGAHQFLHCAHVGADGEAESFQIGVVQSKNTHETERSSPIGNGGMVLL